MMAWLYRASTFPRSSVPRLPLVPLAVERASRRARMRLDASGRGRSQVAARARRSAAVVRASPSASRRRGRLLGAEALVRVALGFDALLAHLLGDRLLVGDGVAVHAHALLRDRALVHDGLLG